MKVFDFFFEFIIFCALLGVAIWMITQQNWVFGTILAVSAAVQGYRFIKRIME